MSRRLLALMCASALTFGTGFGYAPDIAAEPAVNTSELGDLGMLVTPKVIDATSPILTEAGFDPARASILITYLDPENFEYAILFGFFKLVGGFLCISANIIILLRSTSIEDVVKDYVCVAIIAQVDEVMATTLKDDEVDSELKVRMSDRRNALTDAQLFDEYILDKPVKHTEDDTTDSEVDDDYEG